MNAGFKERLVRHPSIAVEHFAGDSGGCPLCKAEASLAAETRRAEEAEKEALSMFQDAQNESRKLAEAERLLALAREALREQWESNHAEHCRNEWPHDGRCTWPQPEILSQLPQEGSE